MSQQHWADAYADKIVRERNVSAGDAITCASGITPSGTVHIGNFREIISVELVVRALQSKQIPTRFIYSWDDFDVFRKVPDNVPNSEQYAQYLRMPITDIPDPLDRESNYALANEKAIENILAVFGIAPEYLYQEKKYRSGDYAEGIRCALEKKDAIRAILNRYRDTPLPVTWWPISIFSSFSKKDTTKILAWDGAWHITYCCEETGTQETIDIRTSTHIKLLWRIDWPMRWKHEKVVFEPAGKDHHSQGGSFDTATHIAHEVYNYPAPVTFQYGFVKLKGGVGKISSSRGEVVSVQDVLEIYQPEVIRYIFAGTRPQSEFAISFDIDVIKVYEDYDRCERIYYGKESVGEKRKEKEQRIYELSQVNEVSPDMPFQIPFRHLCNILQIHSGFITLGLDFLATEHEIALNAAEKEKLVTRMNCAWKWITLYAPEDFKFSVRAQEECDPRTLKKELRVAIALLRERLIARWDALSEKDINNAIYDVSREQEVPPMEMFTALYTLIIGKERGPRMGSFLKILGKKVVDQYLKVE